ncbi:MAG: hypothetical protein K9J16_15610 [Melioribacteraceae bacterium]|nr:hypothetical protein [Melioribacteraceae bacterium]MCF8353361.1 hypothetical protein [Melioribacteraceae bacterium]MCF8393060.1 hypothetical protein [Melioribacteraceae bacterium]MCF8419087.1 hypothetical protein [Melioribacteraceae bacterium]
MKKVIFIALIFSSTIVFGQRNTAALKLGLYSPDVAESGFIIGYQGSKILDEYFSYGWSIDWFNKNYIDKTLANEFDQLFGVPGSTLNEIRAETNLHDIPVMINLIAEYPVARRAYVYGYGGIGAEVLLIFYKNFQNTDDGEMEAAFDFNWRIGAGVSYQLGSKSELLGELTYHASQPSWQYEVVDQSGTKRTFERRFDMSGIMLRFGFRFFY